MKCFWMTGVVAALLVTAQLSVSAQDVALPDDFKINGDPVKGEATFKLYCAMCHGEAGKGDGVGAAALNPKPRNFTDKEEMAKISDKEVFTAIKSGGAAVGKSPLMVAWGAILGDDQKIHDVAAYVRTFAK